MDVNQKKDLRELAKLLAQRHRDTRLVALGMVYRAQLEDALGDVADDAAIKKDNKTA